MSLALTAARAALLRKQASAGKLALAAGALGAAGLGTAAGLGAFAKAKPPQQNAFAAGLQASADALVAEPPRRVPLRQRLQEGALGAVGKGIGNVFGRVHRTYTGGGQ